MGKEAKLLRQALQLLICVSWKSFRDLRLRLLSSAMNLTTDLANISQWNYHPCRQLFHKWTWNCTLKQVQNTIRDSILACAQKLTWAQLNLRHGTKTKKWKTEKLKTGMLRSICKWSGESIEVTTQVVFIEKWVILHAMCVHASKF